VSGVRCSSVTGPATPVTRPVSSREVPGTATPTGRASVSTPTPDHQVERSPSWPRTKLAGSGTCPVAPYSFAPLVDGVWLLVGLGVLLYYFSQKREDWIRNAGAALGESEADLARAAT